MVSIIQNYLVLGVQLVKLRVIVNGAIVKEERKKRGRLGSGLVTRPKPPSFFIPPLPSRHSLP